MAASESAVRGAAMPRAAWEDLTEDGIATFIHDYLDTFPKRDIVEFFAAQPEAVMTLPALEAQLKTDRFVLLRQVRELHELGLVAYHYADAHTRVWHLASDERARQIISAVVAHWEKYPAKRHRIVRLGQRTRPRSG